MDLNRAVGACAWTGTQVESDRRSTLGPVGIELDPVDAERLLGARRPTTTGVAADRVVSLQVTC